MSSSLVTRIQEYLKKKFSSKLVVDGLYGPRTHATVTALPVSQQSVLYSTIPGSKGIVDRYTNNSKVITISRDNLSMLIKAVIRMVPGVRESTIQTIISHEAMVLKNGQFQVNYINDLGYRGLTQMGKPAWTDALDAARELGIKLPSLEAGALDAQSNVLAAALYVYKNKGYLRTRFGKSREFVESASDDILYGMHVQGPQGFKNYLQTGKVLGDQSKKAVATLASAKAELGKIKA